MDDTNKPVSASNYLVSMEKAGYTERSIAAIIDFGIVFLGTSIFSVIFWITIGWFLNLIPFLGPFISAVITGAATFIFPILYNSIFEGGKLASTPGKIYCGLAVRHQSGRKLNYKEGAIRGFGKYISWLLFSLGYALAFVRKDRKALHDFFIDSVVIDKGLGHEKLKKVINNVEEQIQDNIKELKQDLKEYTDD